MRFSLLYNPLDLIIRLSRTATKIKRLSQLKRKPGYGLSESHIDSLELLNIVSKGLPEKPVIYDIGANIGTWTLLAKSVFANATIYSFEPIPKHIIEFENNCKDLKQVFLQQYCAGNENKSAHINISSFSDASSLLKATPLEYETYKISKAAEIEVAVKRLEDLINEGLLNIPHLVKLDIQGYELEALKGMGKYLSQIKFIICEVSFKEYYTNQPLFLEIANYLSGYGHNILAFGYNTPIGEELNQIDVLFKNIN